MEKIKTVITSLEKAVKTTAKEMLKEIIKNIKKKNYCVLSLATGNTVISLYEEFFKLIKKSDITPSSIFTVNLDEYFPIEKNHIRSFYQFMNEHFWKKIGIPEKNFFIPGIYNKNLTYSKIKSHCENYENIIKHLGGIDYQILGIGRNGHIGFNEPGAKMSSITRLVSLSDSTRRDAAPDFLGKDNVPKKAVTMGIKTILDAKKIRLLAFGSAKASAIKAAIEGKQTSKIPASFLQTHKDCCFIIDKKAGMFLRRFNKPINRPRRWIKNHFKKLLNRGLKLFKNKTIVIISPHPDDDVISMGETLRRLGKQNKVKVYYMTTGNLAVRTPPKSFPKKTLVREKEARLACDFYNKLNGNKNIAPRFLRLPFYEKSWGKTVKAPISQEDVKIILKYLKNDKPDIVFRVEKPLEGRSDPHGTHGKVSEALDKTLKKIKFKVKIFDYNDTWLPIPLWDATMIVPLSKKDLQNKIKAIKKHRSQLNPLFPGPYDDREFFERASARDKKNFLLLNKIMLLPHGIYALEIFK